MGQGLIHLSKKLKETRAQYLKNGNEKRKTYQNKAPFNPCCSLVSLLISLYTKSNQHHLKGKQIQTLLTFDYNLNMDSK